MFPSTDTTRQTRQAIPARRVAPESSPAPSPGLLRRAARALRAFALLEDPELEARVARGDALVRAHHRRPAVSAAARAAHRRRPGAVRPSAHVCRSPVGHAG